MTVRSGDEPLPSPDDKVDVRRGREMDGMMEPTVHVLEGEGAFGANLRQAGPLQLALLGPSEEFTVTDAAPGTRFMLMAGQPYGETPCSTGRTWTRHPLQGPAVAVGVAEEGKGFVGVIDGAGDP
jgi:Pirin C-terminal cupin domain